MTIEWSSAAVVAATSLLTAVAALILLPLIPRFRLRRGAGDLDRDMVFLFDDTRLIDGTPEARRFLAGGPADLSDWERFCALIAPRFPGFIDRMRRLPTDGSTLITEAGGASQLSATWLDGVTRLTLHVPQAGERLDLPDAQSLAAITAELDTLRDVVEAMPTPAWQQDEAGNVSWANSAYLDLVRAGHDEGTPLTWPLPTLFDCGSKDEMTPNRQAICPCSGSEHWFDCVSVTAQGTPLFFALPADATVHAETQLRNFVQTLTKTFAELPIGLAVFNRARELVLFNPAMSELFNLEPEFLSSRPTLITVLDRLRETRMMPEPKDYRSWREAILRLERDAQDGVYSDTWNLPTGQVYRVTGRPHPDGAVAFLFEDISAEMSLTRRFRGEIETGQAVIDSLDEAIAVFSNAGILTLSNIAYAELWGDDPLLVMGTRDVAGATAQWQDHCQPDEASDAAVLARRIRQRQTWSGELVHRDGRHLSCRMKPIAGGAVLVGFHSFDADPVTKRAASCVSR